MVLRAITILILATLALPLCAWSASPGDQPLSPAERRHRTQLLNAAVAGGILLWGTANWDYFDTPPKAGNEDWFGHETKEGGADKLGHLYITHITSRAFRKVYLDWGYSEKEAGRLGVLSSLGIMTLMEAGDSFSSEFGFSYEDTLMNLAGAGFSYLMIRYPDLDRKIDLRAEYNPEFGGDFEPDFFTDYEHLKYLLAFKAEGFESIRSPWLKPLELHIGYYARNYGSYQPGSVDNRKRTLYVGLGLNLGMLLRNWIKTPIFDYLQLPYTYLPLEHDLD